MDAIYNLIATLGVAVISLIGIFVQTKSKEKAESISTTQEAISEIQGSILDKIEALRKESKDDDVKLHKKLDKQHINDLKRFLITEMSKIQNKDYVPNEEQKSILKEAKKEYNDLGGDSYVDDMYEDLREQKLI